MAENKPALTTPDQNRHRTSRVWGRRPFLKAGSAVLATLGLFSSSQTTIAKAAMVSPNLNPGEMGTSVSKEIPGNPADTPTLLTAFAPFEKRSINGSAETAREIIQANSQNHWYTNLHSLPDIPVTYDYFERSRNLEPANRIIRELEEKMPEGGVLVMLGEILGRDVTVETFANTTAHTLGLDFEGISFGIPPELNEQISASIKNAGLGGKVRHMNPQEDEFGDFICEVTHYHLLEYANNKLHANPPVKYLPLFVHVPRGQAQTETVAVVKTVISEAQKYFFDHKDESNPSLFVVTHN